VDSWPAAEINISFRHSCSQGVLISFWILYKSSFALTNSLTVSVKKEQPTNIILLECLPTLFSTKPQFPDHFGIIALVYICNFKIVVFSVLTTFTTVSGYQRFTGTYCLLIQDLSPKRWYTLQIIWRFHSPEDNLNTGLNEASKMNVPVPILVYGQ
jgi:hypothetical protein